MIWLIARIFLCALILTAASRAAAQNADPRMGRAGPIMLVFWQQCPAKDAPSWDPCNPPPVDPSLPAEEKAKAGVARAIALISRGKMRFAYPEVDQALKDDPKSIAALVLRARIAATVGAPNGAPEQVVDASLAVAPNDPDLLATKAFLLQDNPGVALEFVNKSLAIDPNSADALWIRSNILIRTNSFEEAERDLARAVTINPGLPNLAQNLAELRARLGRPNPGANDMRPAARGDFRMAQIRAVERGSAGDFAGAVQELTFVLGEPGKPESLLPVTPQFTDLYIQRALALTRIGRADDARRDLDTIVKYGGIRAILRLQIFLRAHGFGDIPVDGQRTASFDSAMETCFLRDNCANVLRTPL